MKLKHLFGEPSLERLSHGSPEWFAQQKKIILKRPLLKHNYDLWYDCLLRDADSVFWPGAMVELGAGGSYLKKRDKNIITSDVIPEVADQVIDATKLPFKKETVKALFLTHVFHHIPDVQKFLSEAERVLVPGGVISMIETTSTPFGRFFYNHFHPEPHKCHARTWRFNWKHNMEDSNQALSWMVFVRDQNKFNKLFPQLEIERTQYLPWLSYIASGGVSRKNLVPEFLVPIIKFLDWLVTPLNPIFSLSWHITIRKTKNP